MEMEVIAKKYVKALTDGVDDMTKQGYYVTISALAEAYGKKEVSQSLNSPLVDKQKKVELVESIVGDDVKMKNFLKLIAERNRFDMLPVLSNMLRLELQTAANEFEGTIFSNKAMSDEEVKSLEEAMGKKTGAVIKLAQSTADYDGVKVEIPDLGVEVGYSKERMKNKLIDFITKSF